MASGAGSGRVPGPEEATMGTAGGPSGGKPGNKRFPPNKKGGRIPPISQAGARKL
jgi:hypothetical protein